MLHPTVRLRVNNQGFQAILLAPDPPHDRSVTPRLSWFGKVTVKKHICPTRNGTSPEKFYTVS